MICSPKIYSICIAITSNISQPHSLSFTFHLTQMNNGKMQIMSPGNAISHSNPMPTFHKAHRNHQQASSLISNSYFNERRGRVNTFNAFSQSTQLSSSQIKLSLVLRGLRSPRRQWSVSPLLMSILSHLKEGDMAD